MMLAARLVSRRAWTKRPTSTPGTTAGSPVYVHQRSLDGGPVRDAYEGDYGGTSVLGRDATHLRCTGAARKGFRLTRLDRLEGLRGQALPARADHHARDLLQARRAHTG